MSAVKIILGLLLLSGLTGSVVSAAFFGPALSVISSFIGASMLLEDFPLNPWIKLALTGLFCFAGMLVQAKEGNKSTGKRP